MGIDVTSKSIKFSSALSALSEVFKNRSILVLLCITLLMLILILILYVYITNRSSKWILKWYGAQKVQRNERSLLYSILEELSKKAGISTPELFSFESEIPEMFTVGGGSKSFLAISEPMLEMFDELELESLIAHEIGHIRNNDVSRNTVTAFLAGLIMSFPNFLMGSSLLLGFGLPEDPAPRTFKFVATALAAPPAATLILLSNPAKRELKADEIGIKLTGRPGTLVKTLEYLENYIPLQPVANKFNPGHFHLFSTHTQQLRGYLSIFISFFDTHPKIEDRITNILKYSNQVEKETLNNKYSRVPGFFDLRSLKLAMVVSLVSYLSLLFLIIVVITFAIKDFDFLVIGIIAGAYIGVVLLLMGTTVSLARRGHHLK